MNRPLLFLGLAVALGGCGQAPLEPLPPAPVAELQGPWLMVNRAIDCAHSYALISPNGIFRVYEDQRPRKQYLTISKFTLEPGKVTLDLAPLPGVDAELPGVDSDIGSLIFAFEPGKLRLLDIVAPHGTSFKKPPDSVDADTKAYLQAAFRINEQRLAMDRCPGT